MKYIFSRKGFDSTAGGYPSLIFPDGSIFSVPIPSTNDKYVYSDLEFQYENESIQEILNGLTGKSIRSQSHKSCDYSDNIQFCHYDPLFMQEDGFEGIALGQAQNAEGHLRNQGIENGDIFLFYGWFKKVEKYNGTWRYADSDDIHLIWSYMEIGDSVYLDSNEQQIKAIDQYPFLLKHPHTGSQNGENNRIYLSRKYNYFSFDRKRCLTDTINYQGRSTWRLPLFFHQPDAFSFLKEFVIDGDSTVVSFRGYGQEFVLNLDKVKLDSDKTSITNYIDSIINLGK